MWYTLGYAKTYLYPSIDRGRTAHPAGGLTVVRCLCVAPLPDPAGQCPWADRPRDWRDPGLRRSDRPQCPACLQYPGPGGPDAPLLCPAADPTCGLRCAAPRAVTRVAAPEPAHLWPRPPVCGPWRWPPRWRMPRASRTGPSVAKPFAGPWHASACAGSGPNTGSPVPIRRTSEKKTARPADGPGRDPSHVGARLWR